MLRNGTIEKVQRNLTIFCLNFNFLVFPEKDFVLRIDQKPLKINFCPNNDACLHHSPLIYEMGALLSKTGWKDRSSNSSTGDGSSGSRKSSFDSLFSSSSSTTSSTLIRKLRRFSFLNVQQNVIIHDQDENSAVKMIERMRNHIGHYDNYDEMMDQNCQISSFKLDHRQLQTMEQQQSRAMFTSFECLLITSSYKKAIAPMRNHIIANAMVCDFNISRMIMETIETLMTLMKQPGEFQVFISELKNFHRHLPQHAVGKETMSFYFQKFTTTRIFSDIFSKFYHDNNHLKISTIRTWDKFFFIISELLKSSI